MYSLDGNKVNYQKSYPSSVVASGEESIAIGNGAMADKKGNIAIGKTATATQNAYADSVHSYAIALGNESQAIAMATTAVGGKAKALGYSDTAIGYGATTAKNDSSYRSATAVGAFAKATGDSSSAFGDTARATGNQSTAIGRNATALGELSTALGDSASATAKNSTAIGVSAVADKEDQITLGTSSSTVYIPGNLVVGGNTFLGAKGGQTAFNMRVEDQYGDWNNGVVRALQLGSSDNIKSWYLNQNKNTNLTTLVNGYKSNNIYAQYYSGDKTHPSDRRLKNVGDAFKGGLEELKKLDLYHFTFKNDENKTPHVGVMAQDLQKVFPDAVTKGDDGYLRIRMEDMFYAVINAVKELDTKITALTEQVKSYFDKVDKLEATIEAQQKTIETLEKQNADFEKRLAKLEKVRNK